MRMLNWPLRSPFKASKRLPGGERKNSNVWATSSWVNLRVATKWIAAKRLLRSVSNSARVSSHLKLLITRCIITHNVKRYNSSLTSSAIPNSKVFCFSPVILLALCCHKLRCIGGNSDLQSFLCLQDASIRPVFMPEISNLELLLPLLLLSQFLA